MTGLIWAVEAILLGCLLIYRWAYFSPIRPAWARLALTFGAGAASGIALTSLLFFLFSTLLGLRAAAMGIEVAILACAGYEVFRHRAPSSQTDETNSTPLLVSITAISLLLALGIATSAMAAAWDVNPQGDWDAWAIWNLRAKFLAAGGALAQRAWSPVLRRNYARRVSAVCFLLSSPGHGRSASRSPLRFRRRHPTRFSWR